MAKNDIHSSADMEEHLSQVRVWTELTRDEVAASKAQLASIKYALWTIAAFTGYIAHVVWKQMG